MAKTFKKIILDDMKANGLGHLVPKIKSIRYESYSMGSSVRVKSLDLFKEEKAAMESLLAKYQYGHFDGMQDLYEISNSRDDIRQAKFVFLNNEYSEPVKRAVDVYLEKVFGVTDDETAQKKMHCWKDSAVWQTIQKVTGYDQLMAMAKGEFQEGI